MRRAPIDKALPWILTAPLGVGMLTLVAELTFSETHTIELLLTTTLVPLLALASLGAWLAAKREEAKHVTPPLAAAIAACALAPMSVIAPWVIVPGKPGVSHGGFSFFLHWLTKYPNLGPINGEVLAGMLSLLAASTIPAALAFYRLQFKARKASAIAVLLGLQLVAYLPVLVRLDFPQLAYAAVVVTSGPMTILGDTPTSLPERLRLASWSAGALLRLAATIAALAISFEAITKTSRR